MPTLDDIEARCNAATPPPWQARCRDASGGDSWFLGWEIEGPPEAERGQFERGADARFVACAREDIPQLIAEVRRLRGLLDELLVNDGDVAVRYDGFGCYYCGNVSGHTATCVVMRAKEEQP